MYKVAADADGGRHGPALRRDCASVILFAAGKSDVMRWHSVALSDVKVLYKKKYSLEKLADIENIVCDKPLFWLCHNTSMLASQTAPDPSSAALRPCERLCAVHKLI